MTVFASPQWRWTADYEPRAYGFVHNAVYTVAGRKSPVVYVTVPVQLFPALDVLFSPSLREHIASVGLDFYLDKTEKGFVFGITTRDSKHFTDLWPYTQATLPSWASTLYRV